MRVTPTLSILHIQTYKETNTLASKNISDFRHLSIYLLIDLLHGHLTASAAHYLLLDFYRNLHSAKQGDWTTNSTELILFNYINAW